MKKSAKSSAEKKTAPEKRREILETSIDKLSALAKKLPSGKELPPRYEQA
ncbi:hypothetical protein HYZ99_05775 [Candidatus Peregrinibacteria bacterium]|nr:hypothetical protein [Candidatus Peregrinibacteria bacterium]